MKPVKKELFLPKENHLFLVEIEIRSRILVVALSRQNVLLCTTKYITFTNRGNYVFHILISIINEQE